MVARVAPMAILVENSDWRCRVRAAINIVKLRTATVTEQQRHAGARLLCQPRPEIDGRDDVTGGIGIRRRCGGQA